MINKYVDGVAVVNAEPVSSEDNVSDINNERTIYKTRGDTEVIYIDINGNPLFDKLTINDDTKEITIDR